MIFRNLETNGDWTFGRGLANYAQDQHAVELNIQTRLKCWVGNCFFDLNMGVDYANLLDKGKKADLLNALRTVIVQSYGVMRVNSVDARFDERSRALAVTYNVDTIFSSGFQQQVLAAAGPAVS